jgi:hypothetical protein
MNGKTVIVSTAVEPRRPACRPSLALPPLPIAGLCADLLLGLPTETAPFREFEEGLVGRYPATEGAPTPVIGAAREVRDNVPASVPVKRLCGRVGEVEKRGGEHELVLQTLQRWLGIRIWILNTVRPELS